MIGRYSYNLLIALDQFGNVLIGGDPDETISSRLGKSQRGDYGPLWVTRMRPFSRIVDGFFFYVFGQKDHCKFSIEEDEGTPSSEWTKKTH